ncbi:hypothetical protein [Rhodococcoides yunnanense]|uniref:hypothetical protein n=1 Tax=Rhodococcoides yunnanense TaxID=278209 RepID=UPI000934B0C5|nr:hypothetical protein [Rhodococcus yunnanensis]
MWSVKESTSDRTDWPESPPPPWPAEVRATIWWHRATPVGRELLPEKDLPVTVAMVVDYLSSPVGPYREILASPVLRRPVRNSGALPRIAVPFIAVDSETSVHGGRTHWSLPKVLAKFGGDVLTSASAAGEEWEVRTDASGIGPRFPIRGGLGFAQPVDDEVLLAGARLSGKARLCRVTVGAEGPTLSRWLSSGTHFGLQIVAGTMTTGPSKLVSGAEV